MGKVGDPKTVIDSKARVVGVSGLRVVDASAFPFLPPGHPSAAICRLKLRCSWDLADLKTCCIRDTRESTMADFVSRYARRENCE